MAFGKRKSNWTSPSRMFWGDRSETLNGTHAGLAIQPEDHAAPAAEDPSPMAADPTQRLLTSLGRFQRQVSKADGGAPSDEWTDECIAQIIAGIEIAHENDWHSVREALTDTARVLQSYEDAGAAVDAIPFLHDSYEILCLMVGDIIVDNVRSGVVNKWRQRYQRALQDLAEAGIPLIEDDGSAAPVTPEAAALPAEEVVHRLLQREEFEAEADSTTFEPWNDAQEEQAEDEFVQVPFDAEEAGTFEEEEALVPELDAAVAFDELAEADDAAEADFDEPDETAEAVIAQDEDAPEPDFDWETGEFTALAVTEPGAEEEAELGALEELDETPETAEDEETTSLDLLDEAAAQAADAPEAAPELDLFAAQDIAPENAEKRPPAKRARSRVAEAPAAEAQSESMAAEAPAIVPDAPSAAVPAGPLPGSAESLFSSMQAAMAAGNVTDAKAVALQLAAAMAEMEVEKADEHLRQVQQRLLTNAEAIAAAEQAVKEAAERVRGTEAAIAQREQKAQEQRERVDELRNEMTTVSESMAAIQAQIRELQARLEAEQERFDEFQGQLDEETETERAAQEELEMLEEQKQDQRLQLEGARGTVDNLTHEREQREQDLADAEAILQTRRVSAEDIARTMEQIR